MPVSTPTSAASVTPQLTVPESATSRLDLHMVVTLLIANCIKDELRSLGLLADWADIVQGIQEGFDVGVCKLPSQTYLFQESLIFLSQFFL